MGYGIKAHKLPLNCWELFPGIAGLVHNVSQMPLLETAPSKKADQGENTNSGDKLSLEGKNQYRNDSPAWERRQNTQGRFSAAVNWSSYIECS